MSQPKGYKCKRYSEVEMGLIKAEILANQDETSYRIAKKLWNKADWSPHTFGALRMTVSNYRKNMPQTVKIVRPPPVDSRPMMQMLRILWDSRRMPDDKLKAMFIKAAKIVDEIYNDIAKARLEIDKMRPAYVAKIEQDESRLQAEMDECAEAMAQMRLVDRELKQ